MLVLSMLMMLLLLERQSGGHSNGLKSDYWHPGCLEKKYIRDTNTDWSGAIMISFNHVQYLHAKSGAQQ